MRGIACSVSMMKNPFINILSLLCPCFCLETNLQMDEILQMDGIKLLHDRYNTTTLYLA
jgi:hypothetical protein